MKSKGDGDGSSEEKCAKNKSDWKGNIIGVCVTYSIKFDKWRLCMKLIEVISIFV